MYKVDKIKKLFDCDLCHQLLVEPITIPCGNKLMVFISLDYSPLKTLNCPGNSTHGVVSVAFDSTYLLASGSSENKIVIT